MDLASIADLLFIFIYFCKQIQNLVMQNFLEAVEIGYSKYKNPYHNLVHAADVLQSTYFLLNNAELMVNLIFFLIIKIIRFNRFNYKKRKCISISYFKIFNKNF